MNVPELLEEWARNATDDQLEQVISGGVPRQYAIIVLAKNELLRRQSHV